MVLMENNGYDPADPEDIERYAKRLEGMTFRDVLDLSIVPDGASRDYGSKRYKGGLGTLLEERYFGYGANSSSEPDFAEAGVELKTTCLDRKKDGSLVPGERLVITMIPMDGPIELDLFTSHLWDKANLILLVFYERDRRKESYDQAIRHVALFTPPDEDIRIIRDDYEKIASYVRAGRAHELSEGMTSYLGACTKGAREKDMWVDQFYPPHVPAKRRAFCFKKSYMTYIFKKHILGEGDDAEPIIKDVGQLGSETLDEYILARVRAHVGRSDRELCELLQIPYTGKKGQWSQIVYALLGVRSGKAEEFEKAGISVRAVRLENTGSLKEALSLETFKFKEVAEQEWEDSQLRAYLEETRFLFVTFKKEDDAVRLAGARFWSMPLEAIDGPVRACWERTRDTIKRGVKLTVDVLDSGKSVVHNDLPKAGEVGSVAHVRPHASRSGYRLEDGEVIGDPDKYGDELPDGRVMTKQSFWLNRSYVHGIVCSDEQQSGGR